MEIGPEFSCRRLARDHTGDEVASIPIDCGWPCHSPLDSALVALDISWFEKSARLLGLTTVWRLSSLDYLFSHGAAGAPAGGGGVDGGAESSPVILGPRSSLTMSVTLVPLLVNRALM